MLEEEDDPIDVNLDSKANLDESLHEDDTENEFSAIEEEEDEEDSFERERRS